MRWLGYALYAIGSIFIVGVPLLMWLWHDGFGWDPVQSEYEQMIMGVYVTLGVCIRGWAPQPSHRKLAPLASVTAGIDTGRTAGRCVGLPTGPCGCDQLSRRRSRQR